VLTISVIIVWHLHHMIAISTWLPAVTIFLNRGVRQCGDVGMQYNELLHICHAQGRVSADPTQSRLFCPAAAIKKLLLFKNAHK
jgi:hypothetical protein